MKMFIYLLCSLWLSLAVHAAELKFEPASPTVEVDKEIELSVIGTVGRVEWVAIKGNILNSGTKVTYRAPLEKPAAGFDVVTVSDAAGNVANVKVTITKKIDFSTENSVWEVFTSRGDIHALLFSDDGKTLWVGTSGGLEKRDSTTGEFQQVLTNLNGLPSNFISALLSDGKGGLWIGTDGGLTHYTADGQWLVFKNNNSSLPSNNISALLSDNQGGLWIGTWEGSLIHYTADGRWQVFNAGNSEAPSNQFKTLLSDNNQGGLWIGTWGGGLAHYSADGQWQVFKTNNSGLPSNYVQSLLSDSQGGLWIGTFGDGLAHYSADGQWQVFKINNSSLPSNDVSALLSDNQGGLWIGTGEERGLRKGLGLTHYTAKEQWQVFNTDNSGIPSNQVNTLLSDNQGGLWVGTNRGLSHHSANGQWQVVNTDNSGMPHNVVRSLLSDSQGGFWAGTGGGLAHYTEYDQWKVSDKENSGLFKDHGITTLLGDSQGGLWIGTGIIDNLLGRIGSGLTHYIVNGQWEIFNEDNSGLPNNWVNALLSDGQGGLWIGTRDFAFSDDGDDGGLAHYTMDGRWQVFNKDNSSLPSNEVSTLLSDSQGGLWIGTYEGLAHYTAEGQWQVFNTDNSGILSNQVNTLLSDSQGGLWVGTNKGLSHHSANGQWQVFNTDNSGLPKNWINTLLNDSQDGLWIGTGYGGLAHYDSSYSENKQWLVFNIGNSRLPSNDVRTLLSDGKGGLWIGTEGGLAHLTFQSKQQGKRAAIVIASGGNHVGNSLWDATESATIYVYKMLVNRKFANDEIYYLSSKGEADFNGDGFDDRIIDAPRPQRPLVSDDIRQTFEWAKQQGKLDQPLYIFFVDHGGTEKLFLNTAKTDYLSAIDLKAMLDDYQTATGSQVMLVIEACYSGSLMPILAAPNRAIITSAKSDEVAQFVGKQGFIYFLTKYLNSGSTFKESYELAQREQNKLIGNSERRTTATSSAAEGSKNTQSPQLDDNGDGNYDPTQDGQWLKQMRINGELQTADFSLAIENLTQSTAINAGQAFPLKAKVVSAKDDVKLVWAVIRPPRINQVFDTNGTPILAYLREYLSPTTEKDIWQTTWDKNLYNGNYEITFYAEDKQGNIASSDQDIILTVSGGIEPPVQAQVQIQLDKTRYQRGEQFKAMLTENLGWGYDLYAAVIMPDGNYFTLKNTNELRGLKEAKPWYMSRKQGQPITLFDLPLPTNLPTGQYCLYGILSPEQNDVFEAMNKNLWVYGQQCFEVF